MLSFKKFNFLPLAFILFTSNLLLTFNIISSSPQKKLSIHYTWIGKPASEQRGEVSNSCVKNHDTLAPKLMAETLPETPIIFWCQPIWRKYYKNEFSKFKNIHVKAIYLNANKLFKEMKRFLKNPEDIDFYKCFKNLKWVIDTYLEWNDPSYADLINPPQRVHTPNTRSCVIIKVAFSYFLIGFCSHVLVIDTNVFPFATDMNKRFHSSFLNNLKKNVLYLPFIDASKHLIDDPKHEQIKRSAKDIWLMYINSTKDHNTKHFFRIHNRLLLFVEAIYRQKNETVRETLQSWKDIDLSKKRKLALKIAKKSEALHIYQTRKLSSIPVFFYNETQNQSLTKFLYNITEKNIDDQLSLVNTCFQLLLQKQIISKQEATAIYCVSKKTPLVAKLCDKEEFYFTPMFQKRVKEYVHSFNNLFMKQNSNTHCYDFNSKELQYSESILNKVGQLSMIHTMSFIAAFWRIGLRQIGYGISEQMHIVPAKMLLNKN